MSNLRTALKKGRCVIGSWINTTSPVVAELMSAAGFDYLTVDVEHSAIDLPGAQVLFQAIRAGNPSCASVVRLPGNDYAVTRRFMDAGADGVIVPLVNSAEQVREVVRAVKYPPDGDRGVGFCRSNTYGMEFDKAIRTANDETFVCVQIEHADAVRNIDDIVSVQGLDAVFVGPYDMSASMGVMAQFDHPEMRKALKRVLDVCRDSHVTPGIHVVQPEVEEVLRRVDEGYRLIAYSLDITMIHRACVDGLSEIRRRIS